LLHYVRELHRAQNYLGYLGLREHYQRIRTHAKGTSGAHLPQAFYRQGIPFIIVLAGRSQDGGAQAQELEKLAAALPDLPCYKPQEQSRVYESLASPPALSPAGSRSTYATRLSAGGVARRSHRAR
jgi:hypothetical protein